MRAAIAALLTIIGAGVLIVGVSLVYFPAGVIAAGLLLAAAGLFAIDVG